MTQAATILVAEDDADDRLLIQEAFDESRIDNPVFFVKDGEELMDYLYRRGDFASLNDAPLPGLVLLDLNMPRKDGVSALQEIRADPDLQLIPVVALTTSNSDDDIKRTYGAGATSFVTKPASFQALSDIVKVLREFLT